MDEFLKQKSCYSDRNEDIMVHYGDELGWDGSSMKYASVSVESAVVDPFSSLAEPVTRAEYDKFIEIAEGLDNVMEGACRSKTKMTDLDFNFVFMHTQRIYVQTAIQSALLGLGIAFTVLLVATRVFHIAFFATFNILCVMISIVGSIVLLGWDLGSIESILIAITAGFAVDYVVHLAHAYERTKGDTYTRMSTAFGEMGISVMSGMVTSVGASIPLFFCQLQFFKKFGTFICLTIAFSWVFANFFFMSILSQAKISISDEKKCCKL
jgi:multidrug efflux pump subunit AcrB